MKDDINDIRHCIDCGAQLEADTDYYHWTGKWLKRCAKCRGVNVNWVRLGYIKNIDKVRNTPKGRNRKDNTPRCECGNRLSGMYKAYKRCPMCRGEFKTKKKLAEDIHPGCYGCAFLRKIEVRGTDDKPVVFYSCPSVQGTSPKTRDCIKYAMMERKEDENEQGGDDRQAGE